MAHIFRMGLRSGQEDGRVEVIPPAAAVALWVRPESTTPNWIRMVQAGFLSAPFFVGWSASRRMLSFLQFTTACRRRTLDAPHWLLFCIGVSPEQQGQGLGAALIRHGVKRVQTTGVPCYLETANPANLAFYQKTAFASWVTSSSQAPAPESGAWLPGRIVSPKQPEGRGLWKGNTSKILT